MLSAKATLNRKETVSSDKSITCSIGIVYNKIRKKGELAFNQAKNALFFMKPFQAPTFRGNLIGHKILQ